MNISSEYSVLGQNIKLSSASNSDQQSLAQKAIDMVLAKAQTIRQTNPLIKNEELSVIISLTLANEILQLKKDFNANLDELAQDARLILQELKNTATTQGIGLSTNTH